jgi:galactokinase
MLTDLAGRLDLAPQLRMASFAYREVVGHPPFVVWQVPGAITLLADGLRRLTVAAPWGAIAAAGPRQGDAVELIWMERPEERTRLTIARVVAVLEGRGPSPAPWAPWAPWAAWVPWGVAGLRLARAGATVLVSIGPPVGSGLGAATAAEIAVTLCMEDMAAPGERVLADAVPASPGPHALLGSMRVPFDLDAAGLRLAVIDTRVRGVPLQPIAERAPLEAAAAALDTGDIKALGPLLTAAHQAQTCDDAQDIAVSAALAAGALGARAITDGPGRPVCALLPASRVPGLRAGLAAEFTRRGLRVPRLITVSPVDGPRRAEAATLPGS